MASSQAKINPSSVLPRMIPKPWSPYLCIFKSQSISGCEPLYLNPGKSGPRSRITRERHLSGPKVHHFNYSSNLENKLAPNLFNPQPNLWEDRSRARILSYRKRLNSTNIKKFWINLHKDLILLRFRVQQDFYLTIISGIDNIPPSFLRKGERSKLSQVP